MRGFELTTPNSYEALLQRLIYYKLICSIDDLLTAGINNASHLVVVNREINSDPTQMADAETIVNVQTVRK